jgi:hypothetical protein
MGWAVKTQLLTAEVNQNLAVSQGSVGEVPHQKKRRTVITITKPVALYTVSREGAVASV